MSTMFPHRRSHVFLVGLVLVDLPVLLAALVLGFWLGFGRVYWAVTDWRLQHPLSLIPSLVVAVVLAVRWWRA